MRQLNKVVCSSTNYGPLGRCCLYFITLWYSCKEAKPIGKGNPKKCCQELLKDWLSTDNGVGPKTWEVLLKQLKEVPELTASVEHIMKQVAT